MLILSRRVNESIVIGDDVKFTIVSIKGNQVRFGFDAPDGVTIHRQEIAERIKAEQEDSQSRQRLSLDLDKPNS